MTADPIVTNPCAGAVTAKDGAFSPWECQRRSRRRAGPETEVIVGRGATPLPDFAECHCRLSIGGAELAHLRTPRHHPPASPP